MLAFEGTFLQFWTRCAVNTIVYCDQNIPLLGLAGINPQQTNLQKPFLEITPRTTAQARPEMLFRKPT